MMCKKRMWPMAGILVAATLLVTVGCATRGAASDDARQIAVLLDQWKTAYMAKDMNALMRLYADSYAHKGKDKAGIAKAVAEQMQENAAYDVRVNVVDATVTVQGNQATVLPVALSGTAGSDTARLELRKENGHWWVTGTDL